MSKQRLPTMELAREAGLPVFRFPKTYEEGEIAEQALANALSKLPLDQQEKILFEVHGIATNTDDHDHDIISHALKELEQEIAKITKKAAYEQALFLNPGYVLDAKFRLLFLKAADFDSKAAAELMAKHFTIKQELFGDGEVLAREVRQSDLSESDMETIRKGTAQILPSRDAGGRAVMIINAGASSTKLEEARKIEVGRTIFYTNMAALRDEGVQKDGIVWACYQMNNFWTTDFGSFEWISRVDASVPIVSVAGHICFGSNLLRPLVAGYQLFTNNRDRHRLRLHAGSLEDIHFKLNTFGIPTDKSPMQSDGVTWSTAYHQEWLSAQRVIEDIWEKDETNGDAGVVIIPRRFDVLFGKSGRARLAVGTQRALHLVEEYSEQYEKVNKFEKTALAKKILSTVHESNGRFLKQDEKRNGCWMQVSDVDARKKVAHWFRRARSKNKLSGKEKNQDRGSPTRDFNSGKDHTRSSETVDAEVERSFKRVSPSPPTDDDDRYTT